MATRNSQTEDEKKLAQADELRKSGEETNPEAQEREEVNATEYSKTEAYNDAVDQETGEVKLGQPGGTDGQAVSDRPTMTEDKAREINGYAGFENVEEQRAADPNRPSEAQDYDKLVKKA